MNGSPNSTNGNMERDVMDGAKFFEKRGNGGFNASANFDDEVEVSLHVDWSQLSDTDCAEPNKANLGTRTGMVYINATSFAAERYEGMWSPTNVTVSLTVDPCKLSESTPLDPAGTFVASAADGSVSMLAEHASIEVSRHPNTTDTYLEVLPGYGLLGSAVTVLPPTANSIPLGAGPSLAFDFFVPDASSNSTGSLPSSTTATNAPSATSSSSTTTQPRASRSALFRTTLLLAQIQQTGATSSAPISAKSQLRLQSTRPRQRGSRACIR